MASKNQSFLLLVLTTLVVIFLFANCMASSSADNIAEKHHHHHPKEKASQDNKRRNLLERCVKLAFDHPSSTPQPTAKTAASARQEWDFLFCRDSFRLIQVHLKVNGFLPNHYIEALERVPKFKKNEAALNEFLCRLDPRNNYRGIPCPTHDDRY